MHRSIPKTNPIKPTLLLSTCGTSLLTNILRQHKIADFHGGHLNQLTNEATLEDIPAERRAQLTELLATVRDKLSHLTMVEAALASAEINGIHRTAGGLNGSALHYLVATDTYVGQQTAELIKSWLEEQGQNVMVQVVPRLSTKDSTAFMDGAKNLLSFLDETVAEYRHSHHIVFNLTGGFKSLLGFMTTFGNFYADEVVYVFESGQDLIRIPRLPIKLDNGLITDHAAVLLRMESDDYLPAAEVAGLPKALLEPIDDYYGLSVWGDLLWKRYKEEILNERLIELPRLHYESSFRRDFERLEKIAKIHLQESLVRVSVRLNEANGSREALLGDRAGGIKYEQYAGKNSAYGHFRFGRGLRVSCEPVGGKLVLRHCGEHDYVNDNP